MCAKQGYEAAEYSVTCAEIGGLSSDHKVKIESQAHLSPPSAHCLLLLCTQPLEALLVTHHLNVAQTERGYNAKIQ